MKLKIKFFKHGIFVLVLFLRRDDSSSHKSLWPRNEALVSNQEVANKQFISVIIIINISEMFLLRLICVILDCVWDCAPFILLNKAEHLLQGQNYRNGIFVWLHFLDAFVQWSTIHQVHFFPHRLQTSSMASITLDMLLN